MPDWAVCLLAHRVEAWLAGNPDCLPSREAADEPQDHRTTPQQTGLHFCAPVDERPGAPPSGKHGAPICTASDGAGTGLERSGDPHARPGLGMTGTEMSRWAKWGRCLHWKSRGWRAASPDMPANPAGAQTLWPATLLTIDL